MAAMSVAWTALDVSTPPPPVRGPSGPLYATPAPARSVQHAPTSGLRNLIAAVAVRNIAIDAFWTFSSSIPLSKVWQFAEPVGGYLTLASSIKNRLSEFSYKAGKNFSCKIPSWRFLHQRV